MMPFVSTITRCVYSHHNGDVLNADKLGNEDSHEEC